MKPEKEMALARTICDVTKNAGQILGLEPHEAVAALAKGLVMFSAMHALHGGEGKAAELAVQLAADYAKNVDQMFQTMRADDTGMPN